MIIVKMKADTFECQLSNMLGHTLEIMMIESYEGFKGRHCHLWL